MLPFLARRLLLAVPTLLGVSVVIFGLLYVVPGDPLDSILAPDASREQRERVAHALGFDQPVPLQYLAWLGRVAHGDLGTSLARNRPASGMRSVTGDGGIGDVLSHLVLPAIAASMVALGLMARMVRASVLDILHQDFVLTLRAKGMGSGTVLKHTLKNAAPPIMTVAG